MWSRFKAVHPEYAEKVGYRSSRQNGKFSVELLTFYDDGKLENTGAMLIFGNPKRSSLPKIGLESF